MSYVMISVIVISISVVLSVLLMKSKRVLTKFIYDGADMRSLYVVEMLLFLAMYLFIMISYFVNFQTSTMGIIISKLYIGVTLYFLLCGKLIGLKTEILDKSLKSVLFTIAWVSFFSLIAYALIVVSNVHHIYEVKTNSLCTIINKLIDYTSYTRMRYEMGNIDQIAKVDRFVVICFSYYLITSIICFAIDFTERRRSTWKNTTILICYLIVIVSAEIIGDDGMQFVLYDCFGHNALEFINSVVFILYSIMPMIVFIRETDSIIYYTEPLESTNISNLMELVKNVRRVKGNKIPEKIDEQIKVIMPSLKGLLEQEPNLWDKLPLERKDTAFIRYLDKKIMKEDNHEKKTYTLAEVNIKNL